MTNDFRAAPALLSECLPTEGAVPLPFDFYRVGGPSGGLAALVFRLDAPARPENMLAAFVTLLSRYQPQASVALNVSRLSAAGEALWSSPFELSTGLEAASGAALSAAAAFLAGRLAGSVSRSTRSRAGAVLAEGGVRAAAAASASDSADDLRLVFGSGEEAEAVFLYAPALFKPSSIQRFAGHLRELLAGFASGRDVPLTALGLLPAEERRRLEAFCDGDAPASPDVPVHRSFEGRARETPRAAAVRYRGETMSYRELNARANALARRLTELGVGAESRVVCWLEPSFDAPVVLLAILKAGAVYVPLDPGLPRARAADALEDIRPALIVTRARLRGRLPEGPRVLELDAWDAESPDLEAPNLDLPADPERTAYIFFTSGTTGRPKGAAASQANLAAYVRAARDRFAIGPSDVMPAIARFSFSISLFELLSPLAAGGTLIVLDRDHVLDPSRLARALAETTFFHAGPSLLKGLLAHIEREGPDPAAFARVRHASSGGDMVPAEVLEGLKRVFSRAEVFVIYGCSEIACMGCSYPAPRDRRVERTFVGRPFEGMSVRVLDAAGNLLPAGIVGEIHFSGAGVVKGYLNRPELTAERFVRREGRRWYRTGDMGRLSEDGWLEILGRADFQVKLRGVRIELGEVEHHLRRAPGVREGAVMAKRLAGEEKSLVAYVALQPGARAADVHRFMLEQVPDYMVPAAYVELEALPLNHNLKLDRLALPDPPASSRRAAVDAAFREPRTDTERRLAALWVKLLEVDRAGLDDHFFDLGGHSLLGVQLITEIKSSLGAVVEGMDVLRESLEEQAALCDRQLGRAPSAPRRASAAAAVPSEALHFGEGRELYGVLTGKPAAEAVLICPSVGQEHVRAHFILRRLAQRLGELGVPSLRFDYYGCGDSMGESVDADLDRWIGDVEDAAAELRRRTGAARVVGVGVRLGAPLLGACAERLGLDRLVVWDPVLDGERYLAELRETHRRFSPGWRRLFRSPAAPRGGTELLGLCCSERAARRLRALRFDPARDAGRPAARLDSAVAGFDPGWTDVARLGDMLPDRGISARLAALALERA